MTRGEKTAKRRAAGLCISCGGRPATKGPTGKVSCCEPCRERSLRNRAKRNALKPSWICINCSRHSGKYAFCKVCYDRDMRMKERRMNGDTQDLSAYPVLARGSTPGGLRYFSGFWPRPSWSKHNRTALTARAGFRPLVKAAKQYEQFIGQAVLVNDLIGWIREGTEYVIEIVSFVHRSDMDQWGGGLMDGLVKSGAMADDKHGEALVQRRVRVPKDQQEKVFIAVYETEKGKSDG